MSGRSRLPAVWRVALATAATLTLGVAILAGVSYAAVARNLEAQVDRDLLDETRAFEAALAARPPATAAELVEAARAYLAARQPGSTLSPILIVRLADGTTISNSDLRLERAWDATATAPAGGFETAVYEGSTYRIASAWLFAADDSLLGAYHAALSLDTIDGILAGLAQALVVVGVAVIVLGSILSYGIARAALTPLARVATTAARISDARLTERIPYDGPNDEVGAMVAALNSMLARLDAAFGEQRRFVADASHELRTPLAVVRGNLELLESGTLSEAEEADALAAACDEIGRIERLVDDLLALARLDSAERQRPFQPLEVGVLLAEVAARARVLAERAISVEAPEDLWVSGDPDLLEQALFNIVRNAVRHTAEGGRIALRAVAAEGLVRLTITDDGPGIPEADLPRVFDRFYRGASTRGDGSGGSGLGLAITKRLLELHGGAVSAGSGLAGGATFTIELPASDPA